MNKKGLMCLVLIIGIVIGTTIGVIAAGNTEEITALLNYGIKINYNGEVQTFKDANGNVVYPISYNGTTYLPVRAVSNLYGIPVDWDGANNTVLLGLGNMNPRDLTAKYTGSSEKNFKINDPSVLGNHKNGVALIAEDMFSESWLYDETNAFLRGYLLSDWKYTSIMKFDVTGIKQIDFDLISNGKNGKIYVYGANSKQTEIGKDDTAIETIVSYKITEANVLEHKTINIDTTKYDTIMFKYDPTTSGSKEESGDFTAYIFDFYGIPA